MGALSGEKANGCYNKYRESCAHDERGVSCAEDARSECGQTMDTVHRSVAAKTKKRG